MSDIESHDPFAVARSGSRPRWRPASRSAQAGRRALGLDGTPHGWMAVVVCDGQLYDAFVVPLASQAIARARPAAVAVDMPVGLVDEAGRDADAAARRLLAGAASTVFTTPPRAVIQAWRQGEVTSHGEASALARAVTGTGVSFQAWRLVPKIAEIDQLAAGWGNGLRECHPELAFRQLTGGDRLPRKRSWDGVMRRRALLADVGVVLPDDVGGGDRAAPDDVLDAAVCAWVAAGVVEGGALQPHPPEPRQVDQGQPIAMWTRPPAGCGATLGASSSSAREPPTHGLG